MLNAFRQSTDNHRWSKEMYRCIVRCSTPFGNQRTITQGDTTEVAELSVLNAFRQSTDNHEITPNGYMMLHSRAQRLSAINGQSLPTEPRRTARLKCAQRLSAINGQSHGRRTLTPNATKSAQRLSAINGQSRTTILATITTRYSAQRLSAINGQSHDCTCPCNVGVQCSTPFGNQRTITCLLMLRFRSSE